MNQLSCTLQVASLFHNLEGTWVFFYHCQVLNFTFSGTKTGSVAILEAGGLRNLAFPFAQRLSPGDIFPPGNFFAPGRQTIHMDNLKVTGYRVTMCFLIYSQL